MYYSLKNQKKHLKFETVGILIKITNYGKKLSTKILLTTVQPNKI